MSKINAVRIINLNYNNNAIKISDETFAMNGETTLLSLQNGGGKSVLVQMMLAPFVHKRYQNAKDRPFASYFTTNKPTFLMVEWKLDGGAGYVLTGMMVRKSQEIAEENPNELEMINFICEYKARCNLDIYHLPVVEKTKKEMVLKNFNACKQLFETSKRERTVPFFYYDMNNSAQSKQYFDKLLEYQINYKEWETIIKKINLKESGLSDLFSDCKDEKGLVEKWFLDAVQNKLNKEKDRMHEFQNIVEKYVLQYKDNQSKIQRRDAIQVFQTEAVFLQEMGEKYQSLVKDRQVQESRIADFIQQLTYFLEAEKQEQSGLEQEMKILLEEIAHLEYEKLSSEIYEIQEKIHFHTSNYELIQMEKEDLERELWEITNQLHLFICARQQAQVDEDLDEYEIEKQKLSLCQEKEQNLEPEREKLGSQLKSYYTRMHEQNVREYEICQEEINRVQAEWQEEKVRLEELNTQEKDLVSEIGETRSDIRKFDEEESRFNVRYQTNFCRNVLGQYEAGLLAEQEKEFTKKMEQFKRERTGLGRQIETNQENLKVLSRNLQDQESEKVRKVSRLEGAQKTEEEFQQELKERMVMLRYFQISEEQLFQREEILTQTAKKLRENEAARRTLETEEDLLNREYQKLTQGQVLELSDDFKSMLENSGIHPVYGMEWLLKNQKSTAQNQKLVQENPFLPYALIMTRQEVERLGELEERSFTSFPVPILIREELNQKKVEQTQAVKKLSDMNFYIWFNENLLDEAKLQEMVALKEREIKQLQENIARKKQEYQEYFGKQEKIRNQKVTKEALDGIKAEIETIQIEIGRIEQDIMAKHQEQEEGEKLLRTQEQNLQILENAIQIQEQKLEDFTFFSKAYDRYLENQQVLEKKQKKQSRLQDLQKLSRDKSDKLTHEQQTKQHEQSNLQSRMREQETALLKYAQYEEENNAAPLLEEEARKAEQRYAAITSRISEEKQELERRVEQAAKRYQSSEKKLQQFQVKYKLTKDQWINVNYDAKEEAHQEIQQEERTRKIAGKDRLLQEEKIKIEKRKTEEEIKRKDLKRQCSTDILLPQSEIGAVNFEDEIQKKNYEKKEITSKLEAVQKWIRGYEELLAALAEYEEFQCVHEITWEQALSELSIRELTMQKGILIRDYNEYHGKILNQRSDLERMLGRVSRMEQFQDSFYQKPLDALMNLTLDATLFLKQLDTILQSFENLMEKLLVDISFVEKEKEKVVELMEDYLKEVHNNLGKIDHNSTITIREKAVKMLKIELLDWTENESMFHLRLQDYVDEVTGKSLGIMEQNGNLREFLGTRITTNELYDAVVGINNVQIRMYKIEAQREYPITWADVAKNSGGEGFLSAFVILSSLLYYMRRDDSDLFADRNEGKVLIMDNPFAQTNASHLLKPLMDMAKKSNTQLICLSGLGGESIYNRFDNIYVLNLIAANLRSGMQYLKSDHVRGSEEETMLVSQIEVVEQMELEF